jgi:hypothetical protein
VKSCAACAKVGGWRKGHGGSNQEGGGSELHGHVNIVLANVRAPTRACAGEAGATQRTRTRFFL